MSLSFVSSAVLTSTDGVSHNEEKAVESTEAESVRRSQSDRSGTLFDQLRTNRDAEEEERDAASKALRGTRTLDEEDCAHLDAIEKRRTEREMNVRAGVEDEVAAFRAARADRRAGGGDTVEVMEEGENDVGDALGRPSAATVPPPPTASAPSIASMRPKIMIKKRRRRQENDAVGSSGCAEPKRQREEVEVKEGGAQEGAIPVLMKTAEGEGDDKKEKSTEGGNSENDSDDGDGGGGGLGGLLGGYGSDSDSD